MQTPTDTLCGEKSNCCFCFLCWMTQVTRDIYTIISVCLSVCVRVRLCKRKNDDDDFVSVCVCVCALKCWFERIADANDAKKCESLWEINTQYTFFLLLGGGSKGKGDRNNRNTQTRLSQTVRPANWILCFPFRFLFEEYIYRQRRKFVVVSFVFHLSRQKKPVALTVCSTSLDYETPKKNTKTGFRNGKWFDETR